MGAEIRSKTIIEIILRRLNGIAGDAKCSHNSNQPMVARLEQVKKQINAVAQM